MLSIIRVCVKWLIFNVVLLLWADVKYHVPTGFFAEDERFFVFEGKWEALANFWGFARA